MISFIRPIAIGNALQVVIEPPKGAKYWRVLRKGSDSFSGVDDEFALNVFEGENRSFVDTESLTNEVMAFYKPYYRVGDAWIEGASNYGTPAAIYVDHSTDVPSFLRDRIEAGMLVEVQRGSFVTDLGYIQVFTAPPSLEQNIQLPVITVQLDHESPGERAIGEDIYGDEFDDDGWEDSEGWLAAVNVSIVCWSLNSDERVEMRRALRRVLVANLGVLDSKGIQQVSFNLTDIDAVSGEFNAPMYQVMCNFSCVAPVRVSGRVGVIEDVDVTVRD
uniref:Uncharacterized protein n=1 Tax=Pseudomonas phage Touem01 TaxID=3138548 RepID=A0AAU6W1U6_9VIRU